MTIDLQHWCADTSDPREYLHKPWRDSGWLYATNGHLALRIKDNGDDTIPARDKHPDVGAMFRKYMDDRACEFLVMPPIPEPEKCSHCGGTGFVHAVKCPDCTDGEFTHGDYEYACKNCAGSTAGGGWVDSSADDPKAQRVACDHCDFHGYPLLRNGATQMGNALYATVYLWALSQLPQCRICPGDPARVNFDAPREVPAIFIFDGGQALLMPRKE